MIKKLNLFIILFISTNSLFAQGFAYYPFNSVLSISTNPTNKAWFDVRLQTNTYFSSLSTELSPMLNLGKKPRARFYVGGGMRLNFIGYLAATDNKTNSPLEGYFINTGVRTMPFKKDPHVHVIFELSPYVNKNADLGLIRTLFGVGYFFGKMN